MINNEQIHENCFMSVKCLKYDVCPMYPVQKLMSGKRKILILWYLSNKVLRFNHIKRKLPDVTQEMLTQQLRSLEEDDLIFRHVYPEVPTKVEYGLTQLGKKWQCTRFCVNFKRHKIEAIVLKWAKGEKPSAYLRTKYNKISLCQAQPDGPQENLKLVDRSSASDYSYDGFGRVTQTRYDNSVIKEYNYNDGDRETGMVSTNLYSYFLKCRMPQSTFSAASYIFSIVPY